MTGVIVGYARVSSMDQDLTVQIQQLEAAGAKRIFSEKKSGTSTKERPALEECLQFVREGDTLVVCRLDRLGRSVQDLLLIVERLGKRGVNFRVINQPIFDLNESTQRLFFTMLAGFAEFETNLRRERQREGIDRAKAEGRYKGRPPKWDAAKTIAAARKLREQYHWGATAIAGKLKMPKRTLYDLTKDADPPIWGPLPTSLAAPDEDFDVGATTESKTR